MTEIQPEIKIIKRRGGRRPGAGRPRKDGVGGSIPTRLEGTPATVVQPTSSRRPACPGCLALTKALTLATEEVAMLKKRLAARAPLPDRMQAQLEAAPLRGTRGTDIYSRMQGRQSR